MKLISGHKYLYSKTYKVGKSNSHKIKEQVIVTYIGSEGNKEVFKKDDVTEILIYRDNVNEFIKEMKDL